MNLLAMNYERLIEKDLPNIEKYWLELIGEDGDRVIQADYSQLFSVIKSSAGWGDLSESLNKPIYNTVSSKENQVLGLVEIVISQKSDSLWVKLLDIHLSPEIEKANDTEENTKCRLNVFIVALLGTFALTKELKNANTVKVYGRTDALVAFLKGMHDSFSVLNSLSTISGINVSIEGRWLVFRSTIT